MIPLRLSRDDARPAVHAPDDVVGRLAACHLRIRSYLLEAEALAAGEGDPERRRASARSLVRYFREALPLHEADEDLSIVPRLADPTGTLTPLALTCMDEHAAIDDAIAVLVEDWERWAEDPLAAIPHIEGHRALLADLIAVTNRHLEAEERTLFPAISALDPATRREIVREMEERRR